MTVTSQKCEQCRDEHQKNKKTKNHEVVPYKQCKRKIPIEKCKIHPTKDIDLHCEECQIPICSKCTVTKEHRGHLFIDLDMVFAEKYSHCHAEIAKIGRYFEPTSQNLKTEIADDVTEIKKNMEDIRTAMKADVKQTLSMCFSVTKVREYTVPGVRNVYHISLGKSGRFWVSDGRTYIVQTDLQGNQLQRIQTKSESYHTVTLDDDLIYTVTHNKVINKITLDNTSSEFIKTGEWKPLSIHSSHINRDLLVGMRKNIEGNVTRFNKTGTEIQNTERDIKGQTLYDKPHYITENINGDVCVSDYGKHAVVVEDKSGQHRFSYKGQGSTFSPYGICTDVFGHILVCDEISKTLHLLDKDGRFLSLLLRPQKGVGCPCTVCG